MRLYGMEDSVSLIALCPGHEGYLLGSLNYFWTSLLSHQTAVLEESLVSWKSVALIAERYQTKTPNSATAELTLVLHAVRSPKHSMAVEPALHELSFVFCAVWKTHHSQSRADAVTEGAIISSSVGKHHASHTMLLASLVPISDVASSVVIPVAATLYNASLNTFHHCGSSLSRTDIRWNFNVKSSYQLRTIRVTSRF